MAESFGFELQMSDLGTKLRQTKSIGVIWGGVDLYVSELTVQATAFGGGALCFGPCLHNFCQAFG